jgi:hypothetical protein
MAVAQQVQGYQEGSRWINERPSGEEVAKWFIDNAPMHPGMDPARYVTGVVLIPAKEKARRVVEDEQGRVTFPEVEQLVYIPYVKVETRVAYFWDYVRTLGDAVGAIEPADVPRLEVEGVYNMNLPPGFFRLPVQDSTGKFVHFLCCSQQVRIWTLGDDGGVKGMVMAPATGSKMVPLLTRWGVDEHALMKAETGAVGRALGMAGMLVLPGSGVATAEDMQEMIAAEGRPSVGVDAQLPSATAAPDDQIRARIAELSVQLQSDFPGRMEDLQAWAAEKKIDLNDIKAHQLRGVLRALEKKIEGEA